MSQFRGPAAPPLAYATPAPRRLTPHLILRISLAAIAGLLTADSLASAMGASPAIDVHQDPVPYLFRFLISAIVFALVLTAILPIVRLTRAVVERIAQSPTRPSPAASLSLIFCGTACILAALGVEVYLVRYVVITVRFSSEAQPPLFGHLITIATFLAGAALCGLGAWGSGVPATTAAPASKVEQKTAG
jgi:hypothetical protein